ncbi:Holliday junction resolvase RuvX [Lapillicoccus sp.]|uniref:Holliday junction resolvase RuvX n=1 Tax=Lapillicoccus sp. TaxID=1909287 RepID=UPI00344E179C
MSDGTPVTDGVSTSSRTGVRLGVDVGSVRVGLSASDPSGLLASPVETVARDALGGADQHRVVEVAAERNALEVVVGLPRSLTGAEGAAAATARSYAVELATLLAPTPVRLVDERLTTVDAHRRLRESGVAGRAQRAVIDQAAAVLILQNALDAERASGRAPGELVRPSRLTEAVGARPRRRKKTPAGRSVEPVPGSGESVGDSTGGNDRVTKTEEPR